MKFLTLATIGLLATTSIAHATDGMDLSQDANTIREQNAYTYEFDRDEQCQGYAFGLKRLGITNPCAKEEEVIVEQVVVQEEKKINVLNEYVVYFDFDDATVRQNDKDILTQAAGEIAKYNPRKVLVAGYTDTRGSNDYNDALSARRANNVSNYLESLGVNNFVVDEAAMGETNLAVPTADEVKLQENRRVNIQFIR